MLTGLTSCFVECTTVSRKKVSLPSESWSKLCAAIIRRQYTVIRLRASDVSTTCVPLLLLRSLGKPHWSGASNEMQRCIDVQTCARRRLDPSRVSYVPYMSVLMPTHAYSRPCHAPTPKSLVVVLSPPIGDIRNGDSSTVHRPNTLQRRTEVTAVLLKSPRSAGCHRVVWPLQFLGPSGMPVF